MNTLAPSPRGELAAEEYKQQLIDEAVTRQHDQQGVNYMRLYNGGPSERAEDAAQCLANAELMEQASLVAEPGSRVQQFLQESAQEQRLHWLFITPEDRSPNRIAAARNILLNLQEERQRENGWDFVAFKNSHIREYDLLHLMAYWNMAEAQQASSPEVRQSKLVLAETKIGVIIRRSVDDLALLRRDAFRHRTSKKGNGEYGQRQGLYGEFFMLTALRLAALHKGDFATLERMALPQEDVHAAQPSLSADVVTQNPARGTAHFGQVKTGGRARSHVHNSNPQHSKNGRYTMDVFEIPRRQLERIMDHGWGEYLFAQYLADRTPAQRDEVIKNLEVELGFATKKRKSKGLSSLTEAIR